MFRGAKFISFLYLKSRKVLIRELLLLDDAALTTHSTDSLQLKTGGLFRTCLCWIWPDYQHRKEWGAWAEWEQHPGHQNRRLNTQCCVWIYLPGLYHLKQPFTGFWVKQKNWKSCLSHGSSLCEGFRELHTYHQHHEASLPNLRAKHSSLYVWCTILAVDSAI